MIAYRATLDVPEQTVRRLTRWLRQHQARIGTPPGSRAASARTQAILVLRWFRDDTGMRMLARDAAISIATGYRYLHEGIDVLAAQAPDLHQVLARGKAEGWSHVTLDGTLIATDRCAATTHPNPATPEQPQPTPTPHPSTDDSAGPVAGPVETPHRGHDVWYSGKHKHHGGNVQVMCDPSGFPVWTSPVEPGSVHDITAARRHVLPALYAAAAAGLPTLADKGYTGAGIGIHVPTKRSVAAHPDPDTACRNQLQVCLRALGERGNAILKTRWTALQHIRLCPQRIGQIAAAALVLSTLERPIR